MTQDTRILIARALRRAAEAWDQDADSALVSWTIEARMQTKRDASFARGFAEALENGCTP